MLISICNVAVKPLPFDVQGLFLNKDDSRPDQARKLAVEMDTWGGM